MLTMEITRLIEQCRQGDAEALGELYKAYAKRMRGVCRRYISDEDAVNDVLHDAFVIIFTSFDKLRDDQKAEAWMMSITRNVASKYKDQLMTKPFVSLKEAEQMPMPEEKAEVRGMPLEDVLRLIERLPEGYSQVFRLSVFDGLSHKEIAGMLGIEPHSSSSQLARAKKMLRKMMRQYWAAVLLLLLVPITLFLFRKGDTAVKDDDGGEHQPSPVVAKQKATPKESQRESVTERPESPVIIQRPLQLKVAQTADTITVDTLSNIVAQAQTITDTVSSDTAKIIREVELPHLFPDEPTISMSNEKKWSLQLAYAGQFDEQNRYNQPFSYKPAPSDVQPLPSGHEPTIPSSIDNWTDYAVYLENNPDATSHHQMPVTWSLALKYRLDNRFGLESGLGYCRLTSDFEIGANGRSATDGDACLGKNTIREHQTIHYLDIPVKGIYNMYGRKRWGIYGSLGLTTGIPVHSTLQSDFYVNGQYEASDKTTIRAPWQFSTTFGLGLQYHLTPNVGFFAEPSLQYYIPMPSDIETYRTEHPFTFSLPLGIRFTW